jgi:hypothetical protein
MFNKFYKLEFGLQMIIICFVLFFSNQLTSYTLTFGLFLLQTISIYLGVMSIINHVKQTKTKNNDEQSN